MPCSWIVILGNVKTFIPQIDVSIQSNPFKNPTRLFFLFPFAAFLSFSHSPLPHSFSIETNKLILSLYTCKGHNESVLNLKNEV